MYNSRELVKLINAGNLREAGEYCGQYAELLDKTGIICALLIQIALKEQENGEGCIFDISPCYITRLIVPKQCGSKQLAVLESLCQRPDH